MNNSKGLLIILSGPSGAGKDTVLKELLAHNDKVRVSISATTRQPRQGEENGRDYHFISREQFETLIQRDGVLEYAEYCGNFYGTPRAQVETWLDEGLDVVLEIEVQGAKKVMAKCPEAVSVFILPPSFAVLEKRLRSLFRRAKKQPSGSAIHLLSFFITLLGVVLVLVLTLTLLIPELVQSFHSLYLQIESNIPRWTAYLSAQDTNMDWLMHWLEGIDWEQLLHRITNSIDTVLVNAVGAVSATVNIVVTASFALIISIYMSLGAESLCHHARTLVCAYLKPSHAAGLLKFCRLFRQSFANFLTGQCSEAVILGVLMTLAFSVFRIPYGSLVGMLTAICAIIPYVGALISCVVSVFLVLLVDPVLAVRCLIVYLAVQFIENQFIYPRVVGKSVGLSPFYTLVAAMIGGKLFGIIGIIFFIPLTAVVIELAKEDAFRRLHTKETLS